MAFAVDVRVGALPPAKSTDDGKVTVKPEPDPSCLIFNTKLETLPLEAGFENEGQTREHA